MGGSEHADFISTRRCRHLGPQIPITNFAFFAVLCVFALTERLPRTRPASLFRERTNAKNREEPRRAQMGLEETAGARGGLALNWNHQPKPAILSSWTIHRAPWMLHRTGLMPSTRAWRTSPLVGSCPESVSAASCSRVSLAWRRSGPARPNAERLNLVDRLVGEGGTAGSFPP
jgi:hypothetical protein